MSLAQQIELSLNTHHALTKTYIQDLSDADLLLRPTAGANHIAWSLGHLIVAENGLISSICPGSVPDLPPGFAEKHTNETAGSDDPAKFCPKDEYLRLMDEQREGTLSALRKLGDADLEKESPEQIRSYAPTVASVFFLMATHQMMHSGQWVVVRRMLGKPAMF